MAIAVSYAKTRENGPARTWTICGEEVYRMATIVDFQKVREDSREVEYIFGFPEMNRHMVIRKETQQATPADGLENPQYARALGKILLTYRQRSTWPNEGMYAA